MTQPTIIRLGEWLPDLPEWENPGALEILNAIPQLRSYRDLPSLASFTNALVSACLGSFWMENDAGVIFNFAGDTANLYRLDSSDTWTTVNGPSGPYTAVNWDFTEFGDLVIATNKANVVQVYDTSGAGPFADLGGSPPQAARCATVRDFVVLGDLSGTLNGTTLGPNFVAWSGFNNAAIWGVDIATQTDFNELFGRGGKVQRIVPGEYGVIVQEHSIQRMDYVGPAVIFQFSEVEKKRGTPSPNSVMWHGGITYYYGWDGFYAFDGEQSLPMSENRVSRWFKDNSDISSIDTMRGVVDRQNRLLIWAFKSSSALLQNDRLLIYNWAADRWSHAEVDTQVLEEFISSGFTLDELDTPLPLGIDTDSIAVDSAAFQGGALSIQAFDSSNRSALFSGTPLAAILDTQEVSGPDNARIFSNSVRPLVEGSTATDITVEVGSRNSLRAPSVFSLPRSLNQINGEAATRINSRYQRYRLNINGGFDHADGVRVQLRTQGGRR